MLPIKRFPSSAARGQKKRSDRELNHKYRRVPERLDFSTLESLLHQDEAQVETEQRLGPKI